MVLTNQTEEIKSKGPLAVYDSLLKDKTLKSDKGQREVVAQLQLLFNYLVSDKFDVSPRSFLGFKRKASLEMFGAYIWGDVGRGKSMIMDMFYETIPFAQKRRIHFHAFMRDVHARIHAWRQLKAEGDLLPRVVGELVQDFRLLCLDELQVHDVTDAMILSRLFTLLFEAGVVIVITSNRSPNELYQGGLQREQFEQFIALAQERMNLLELVSPHDYRLKQLKAMKQVYFTPLGERSAEFLYGAYLALTQGQPSQEMVVEVQGRKLLIEKTAAGVAWMTFAELCERPLGAGDYLELAAIFHTLIVQDIPTLIPEKRNEAKRFVTLIDTLYDHKVKLICSAEAPAEELYPKGDGSFEFQRTVSRLKEMQSEHYLGASHISE